MSRIIQLTAENVKRLRAVNIKPDGNIVIIGGNNGQGKSSTLDSIAYAIGGKDEIADVPIRQGQEKARIVLELDDLIIKRTFTASGTTLTVENKEGARYPSPQSILDKLTGKLTFDPLEFLRLKKDRQAEELKKLVGLDLSDLDAQRKKIYDERTAVNRDAERLKLEFDGMPHHPEAPQSEQSATEVLAEIEVMQKRNAAANELKDKPPKIQRQLLESKDEETKQAKAIAVIKEELALAERKLEAQKNRSAELQAAMQKASQAAAEAELEDVQPLKDKLSTLEKNNKMVRENQARLLAQRKVAAKQEESKKLTEKIEAVDRQREERLSKVKYPVEGLAFDENGVLFNGLPFNQASTAEQLRVSVAIAANMNPKLRVMLLRHGNDLDDTSMALLSELAEQHDLQIWVERVGKGDKCSVIIEDGAVEEQPTEECLPEQEAATVAE